MSTIFTQSDATAIPLADKSVNLTFTSPPYMDARTYGIGAQRNAVEWVDWMVGVVRECVRVTDGLVLINCGGVTRDWNYWPGCEGLIWECWRAGIQCWRPCYWRRVGIPGSGGKQWYRGDVEYILPFTACKGPIPWAKPTANGHPPKWAPGGSMSHRLSNGARVNQWGHSVDSGATLVVGEKAISKGTRPSHKAHTKRRISGTMEQQSYLAPALANPGNVVEVKVGGGLMGSKFAHENEAPFPEALPTYFIRSHCPPGGTVLDPFSGSGTTVAAAVKAGCRGIGFDLRMSQCELGRRRIATECPLLDMLGPLAATGGAS